MEQEKIGQFIASCRKEQGLTQMQFADKLGVTNKAVSKWETGRCLPDAALYEDICLVLKITLNELFAGERIAPENVEKKAEENLKDMAAECQKKDNRETYITYFFLILLIICVAVNVSVGGMWLEGSPVFSNLLLTALVVMAGGFFLNLTRNNEFIQKCLFVISVILLISSAAAFVLSFWDADRHIVFWLGLPWELPLYGLRMFLEWMHIYMIAVILSGVSLACSKSNLNKI